MQLLQHILQDIELLKIEGSLSLSVTAISIDSRTVSEGSLFVAIVGATADGHTYISKAIDKGAKAILCSSMPQELTKNITYILVKDTSATLGFIAGRFYNNPSEKLILTGITGTNGKTTIATMLFKLFKELGYKCGLISTVQNQINDTIIPASHTTPDAISLNALLNNMFDQQCSHVFMECSSHAIHQHRIAGLKFSVGIFSNITHDHLDYHNTFDEYIKVKKSFFDNLPSNAIAISNLDDKRGTIMLQNTKARRMMYSLHTLADFKGKIIENNLSGLIMNVNEKEVHFRMIGEFNAYNLLAVYGAAISLKQAPDETLTALSNINGAEGRFDYTISLNEKIIGIVDYAHTPDALLNVLATIKKLRKGIGQVITVIGCGGDRDKLKRPIMATVACEYSHKAILTSDNPRTEDPLEILSDMQNELKSEYKRRTLVIADRREAIKTAVTLAQPGDIILLAGKGHEKYQEINGIKQHFSDKEEMLFFFNELNK